MLISFIWVLLAGFFAGQLAAKLKAPPLIGMILCGIAIGPQGWDRLSPDFLDQATALRTMAVMIILAKAGLGLDRDKLRQQGSVAIRLGFLPATCEAIVIAIAAGLLFQMDMPTGVLLGCVLAAESPAVIVPGMLFLKQTGWGVKKGIPDAILTGSALSDVLVLLVFNLVLNQLTQASADWRWGILSIPPSLLLPFQIILQVGGGVLIGWGAANILNRLLKLPFWVANATHATLVTAGLALSLVMTATQLPVFSGYLAVMTLGFLMTEYNPPQARRLRQGFSTLWAIAQIILFVLLGASIQPSVLGEILVPGLAVLAVGTLLGRGAGWYLSTLGSNWTAQERLYLLAGNSAKATVQAAIGAIPLAAGLPGGDVILAFSALSILVTAPLGAWAIPFFAPRLLAQDEVDPTKVLQERHLHLLVGVNASMDASATLRYAAHLARCSDGRVNLLYLDSALSPPAHLVQEAARMLADIPHQWEPNGASTAEQMMRVAEDLEVDQIVLAPSLQSTQILNHTPSIPVLLVPATDSFRGFPSSFLQGEVDTAIDDSQAQSD